jgi:hypothetical protein
VTAGRAVCDFSSPFVQEAFELDRQLIELQRVNTERFARIEERFAAIEAILLRHEQLLQALPEAIREKIGFKAPGT